MWLTFSLTCSLQVLLGCKMRDCIETSLCDTKPWIWSHCLAQLRPQALLLLGGLQDNVRRCQWRVRAQFNATTGGVWLPLYNMSPVCFHRFVFWGFVRNRRRFTALGTHFILTHFVMTPDTSERNISYDIMTSFWFLWYDSC